MSPLDGNPCTQLTHFLFLCVGTFPADSGRINQQFSSFQGHDACSFGIPLVPAHLNAQFTDGCLDRLETQVAGCEIEFLVIGGIVRNMHLAVFPGHASICIENNGCIVVQAGCPTFEKGSDQHDVVGGCQFTIESGRRTGDRFGQVEQVGVFGLTEIRGVMQFLEYYQLSTCLRYCGNVMVQFFEVEFDIVGA